MTYVAKACPALLSRHPTLYSLYNPKAQNAWFESTLLLREGEPGFLSPFDLPWPIHRWKYLPEVAQIEKPVRSVQLVLTTSFTEPRAVQNPLHKRNPQLAGCNPSPTTTIMIETCLPGRGSTTRSHGKIIPRNAVAPLLTQRRVRTLLSTVEPSAHLNLNAFLPAGAPFAETPSNTLKSLKVVLFPRLCFCSSGEIASCANTMIFSTSPLRTSMNGISSSPSSFFGDAHKPPCSSSAVSFFSMPPSLGLLPRAHERQRP